MDNLAAKRAFIPYLPPELLLQAACFVAQHPAQRIKDLLALGLVNKQYNQISTRPELWHTIFLQAQENDYKEIYLNKKYTLECPKDCITNHEKFLYRVSLTPLKIDSPIGREFYQVLVTLPFVKSIIASAIFENIRAIEDKKIDKNQVVWPQDFNKDYIKLAVQGLNDDVICQLKFLFKICCNSHTTYNVLIKLYKTQNSIDYKLLTIPEESLYAWMAYIVSNRVAVQYAVNNYTLDATAQKKIIKQTAFRTITDYKITFLAHCFIRYLTKDIMVKEGEDEFGQNALINACRTRDLAKVKKLLNKEFAHKETMINHKDMLGLTAPYIAIVDYSDQIFDVILKNIQPEPKNINCLLSFAIEHCNMYAVEKLLTFYKDISYIENFLPIKSSYVKFLTYTFNSVLLYDDDKCRMIKMFLDKGIIFNAFTTPALQEILNRFQHNPNHPKANFLRNYFKSKSWF